MVSKERRGKNRNIFTVFELPVKKGCGERESPKNLPGCKSQGLRLLLHKHGFGLNEVIGIAAGVLIAVLVVVPGLRLFATEMLDDLKTWWTTMSSILFAST